MIFKSCLSLIMVLAATTAHAAQSIERRAAADAQGTVEVSIPGAPSGTLQIRGWDRNEIQVTGVIDDDAIFEFTTVGQRTTIRVNNRRGNRLFGDTDDTRLSIMLPTRSRLSAVTVSADMLIEGMRSAQDLRSVSGGIDTEFWQDDLDVHSVSGDIRARGHGNKGVFTVQTVSGDVELFDAQGEINGTTVSGDLRLRLGTLTRGRFNTTSGDISVSAALAKDSRVDFESTSGDIELRTQSPMNAQLELATFSGDIRNCFGPRPREPEHGPGQSLYFIAGDGSARIKAKTLSGDLRVCDK